MMNAKKGVAFGIAICLVIFGVATWYLLWSYRSHRLIQVRGISSLLLTSGTWTIGAIFWNLGIAFEWNCFVSVSIGHIIHNIICYNFTERAVLILMNFVINHEAANSANQNQVGKLEFVNNHQSPLSQTWSTWVFKNRKRFTSAWDSPSKLISISIAVLNSALSILCFWLLGENLHSPFCSENCYQLLSLYYRCGIISGAISTNLAAIVALKLLKITENFYLKQELAMYGLFGIGVVLSLSFRTFTPQEILIAFDRDVMVFGVFFMFILPIICKGITLFLVYKARIEDKMMREHLLSAHSGQSLTTQRSQNPTGGKNVLEVFLQLLHNEHQKEEFKAFLITEFSVENLLFWEAVHSLRNLESKSEKTERSLQVIDDFCSENSKHEVNLSFSQTSSLRTLAAKLKTEKVDSDTRLNELIEELKRAQQAIESLMFEDSYRRFRRKIQSVNTTASMPMEIQPVKNITPKEFPIEALQI
jgi:hypothetical protein